MFIGDVSVHFLVRFFDDIRVGVVDDYIWILYMALPLLLGEHLIVLSRLEYLLALLELSLLNVHILLGLDKYS